MLPGIKLGHDHHQRHVEGGGDLPAEFLFYVLVGGGKDHMLRVLHHHLRATVAHVFLHLRIGAVARTGPEKLWLLRGIKNEEQS